ncbi:MAG: urea ABC transporter ATP-binding subunit UrtE [Bacteroides sp.]|nr:urea ABC transporter ATP-binding subunit UrtE [Bacteroides sp.]MCM1549131.1 urea ABC transporter ATP-binding subunit UrtE [Clostridium sp.]
MLELTDVHISYGKSKVINGVDFSMETTEKVALLGRNGVGKTTLLKSLIGILPVESGRIIYEGDVINKKNSYERSIAGIAYVPQGREIIPDFTVKENLELGGISLKRDLVKDRIEEVLTYFPALKVHYIRKGGVLSGGLQQQLAISRALISHPKILLLDEPTEGIQPNIVAEIASILNQVHKDLNLGIILVEQNLNFVFKICDSYILMQKGQIVNSGRNGELTDDIIKKYLTV